MKKDLSIIILIFGLAVGSINAQPEKSSFFGINLPPIRVTMVELGYELNSSPYLTFELYGGYLINTTTNSSLTILTGHNFERKSGFFLMPGARFNFRRDPSKFAPFIGMNLVNSVAIEQGTYYDGFTHYEAGDEFSYNSYNLGLTGIIGLTTPSTARISCDIGIRAGKLLINNLIDIHSFMPGMGVGHGDGWRTLGVQGMDIGARYSFMARLKYRIK